MSEIAKQLQAARQNQVRARYARHYTEGENFVIEALTPNLTQIIVKPNESADLLGDLLKYVFSNCKRIDEDY